MQGMLAACIVFPIAAVVHARSIHINLSVHWAVLLTLVPLACVACSALGLTFGTIFDPRNMPLMFGIIILPLTFLGGTYYAWTTLSPVTVWGVHWLQILVLVNPLVYINEGSRAALTTSGHMSLWAVYPALIAFTGHPVGGHGQLPATRDKLGPRRGRRVPCYLRAARRGGGAVERTGLENRQWSSRSLVGRI